MAQPPPGRIINKNPWLFGPGPVRRINNHPLGFYARMGNPHKSFGYAAAHGIVIALVFSYSYKYFIGDPQIKKIEDYYKENP